MSNGAHDNPTVGGESELSNGRETTRGDHVTRIAVLGNVSRQEAKEYDNHTASDDENVTGPSAIDIVLSEIGENVTGDDSANGNAGKSLSFEDGTKYKEDEQTDQTCKNPIYRYKVLDTIWLFWNVTTMGWVYGQMGPSLPDLQVIGDVQLQQATWLFTGFAIGYLGGCLIAGLIQDKFNPRLMLFLYTAGTAITVGLLPWLPNFVAMVIIRVLNGLCIGGQDTGLHSMLFALWAKDGGPFIQMTHCLSALGGIISPLVTQPFLLKSEGEISYADAPISDNITTISPSTTNTTASVTTETSTALSDVIVYITNEETRVQYAFLITAILTMSAAIPFLVAFLQKRRIKKASRQYSNDSVDRNKLPKKIKTILLVIMFTNSFIATAYIDLFPSFLTTFVIQQLNWSKQSASSLTSLYFGTYGVGNFVGVFILAYISSTKLITFSYVTSGISLTGVLLSVIFEVNTLVWVTVGISGFTMSAILPTLFTWVQENVTPITGRLASALLISGSAGVMANPIFLGYMMEEYSSMWFLYLSLGETVVCSLLFAIAFSLSNVFRSSSRSKLQGVQNEIEEPMSDEVSKQEIDMPGFESGRVEIYTRGALFGV